MKLESRHLVWLPLVLLAMLAVAVVIHSSLPLPAPLPNRPGTFAFAALGDAPYPGWENTQYRSVLRDLAAHDLEVVVHVGDIFDGECTDQQYASRLAWFRTLPHPVVYTPGDNEWTDCGEAQLDRLAHIRRSFFADPARSLGGRSLPLTTQGARAAHAEFVENARWTVADVVFATVHIVGSANGTQRGEAMRAESERRTRAAAAWVRETFAVARSARAAAVVLAYHADAPFDAAAGSEDRAAFEPFLQSVEEAAEAFGRPVLLVHGDGHDYKVDHPVRSRSSGRTLANVTRLEVPGSPAVGWVRVAVDPRAPGPFSFTRRVRPRYELW